VAGQAVAGLRSGQQEAMLQRTLPAHAPAVTAHLATAVLCALVCVAGMRTLEQTDSDAYPGASPADMATQAQANIAPLECASVVYAAAAKAALQPTHTAREPCSTLMIKI